MKKIDKDIKEKNIDFLKGINVRNQHVNDHVLRNHLQLNNESGKLRIRQYPQYSNKNESEDKKWETIFVFTNDGDYNCSPLETFEAFFNDEQVAFERWKNSFIFAMDKDDFLEREEKEEEEHFYNVSLSIGVFIAKNEEEAIQKAKEQLSSPHFKGWHELLTEKITDEDYDNFSENDYDGIYVKSLRWEEIVDEEEDY